MSAILHYVLRCDFCGCGSVFDVMERRADVTRSRASQAGWVHGVVPPDPHRGGPTASLDYCPEHADQLGDLRPKTLPTHARPA